MKITRIRIYQPQEPNPHFHQSDMVVTIETDEGLTGIGEGGSRDTLEQCVHVPGRSERLVEDVVGEIETRRIHPARRAGQTGAELLIERRGGLGREHIRMQAAHEVRWRIGGELEDLQAADVTRAVAGLQQQQHVIEQRQL